MAMALCASVQQMSNAKGRWLRLWAGAVVSACAQQAEIAVKFFSAAPAEKEVDKAELWCPFTSTRRTQGRTVGSGSAQVVLVVGCRSMFLRMSCVPAASQLLPLGREGWGQPRHVHRQQPENWPFNVLRALYLWSDSEEPRSEHLRTSGVTLESPDPRRKFFFVLRGSFGCSKESVAARTPSCTTWSLGIGAFPLLSSFSRLRDGYYVTTSLGMSSPFRVRFFVCRLHLRFFGAS